MDALAHPDKYTVNGRAYLMLEFPEVTIFPNTDAILLRLLDAGIVPIITHPERNGPLQRRLDDIARWVGDRLLCAGHRWVVHRHIREGGTVVRGCADAARPGALHRQRCSRLPASLAHAAAGLRDAGGRLGRGRHPPALRRQPARGAHRRHHRIPSFNPPRRGAGSGISSGAEQAWPSPASPDKRRTRPTSSDALRTISCAHFLIAGREGVAYD